MATALNLAIPLGTATAKSFAYDNANYTTIDSFDGVIPAAANVTYVGGTATVTSGASLSWTSYGMRQIKSVTVVPNIAPTAADQLTLTLYSLAAQAFGTATGVASPALAGGTATSTSYNKVQVFNLTGTATNFLGIALNSPLYNPMYVEISGAKNATIVVAGPAGTNTQTAYTFPSGPNGGLTMNPGDLLVVAKGTDTVGSYTVEVEQAWTPGASFTA
jgi:hypothetical protein